MQDQDWDRIDGQTDATAGRATPAEPDTARLGGDAPEDDADWLSRGTAANTGASTLNVFAGTRQLEDAPQTDTAGDPGDASAESFEAGGARAAGGGARAAYRNDPERDAGDEPRGRRGAFGDAAEPNVAEGESDAAAGQSGEDRRWAESRKAFGHLPPDLPGGTDIAGPQDRSDTGSLRGGQDDAATGGSDLGPTTGGGDTGAP